MKWEYYTVNLNIENSSTDELNLRDPEAASENFKGSLSPEFIKTQFPEQYQEDELKNNPCLQLTAFLNAKGQEGWELFQSLKVGDLFLLIMKRPLK